MPTVITASSVTPDSLDTEKIIHEIDPAIGTYGCKVDMNNLAAGDAIILRLYDQVADGTYRLSRSATYANAQGALVAEFEPIDVAYAVKWTVEQTDGTLRAFPFLVVKTDVTAADNADAVWDETSTGHTDAGKAGAQMWTDIDAILVDTGTSGVVLADGALSAAKCDADIKV